MIVSFAHLIRPVSSPAPAPRKRLDRVALDNAFADKLEERLTKAFAPLLPAPATVVAAAPPVVLSLADVKTGVAEFKRALAVARRRLAAATEANRPAAVAAAQTALEDCRQFNSSVLEFVEANPLGDDNEVLCYALCGLDSLTQKLEEEVDIGYAEF